MRFRPLARARTFLFFLSWGLRPRLYAAARFAGSFCFASCRSLLVRCRNVRRPNIDALLSDAGALVQAGRLEEAEAATRKILSTHPRNAEAHSLLGVILDQRGNTAEAEKQYDAALRLKPKLVSALSNLGVLLARTNRTSEAIAKFEEVLRIDPKHERAMFNLGSLYAVRGDYKRAVPLLEKTAGAAALFTLALKLAEAGEYTRQCVYSSVPTSCGRRRMKCSTTSGWRSTTSIVSTKHNKR